MRYKLYGKRIILSYKYLILLLILACVGVWLRLFSVCLKPKIIMIAKNEANQLTNNSINECINNTVKNYIDINLLNIIKNNNDEIVVAEYRLNQVYGVLEAVTNELYKLIDDNNQLIMLPLGMVSGNVFLNNMGPKIPIKTKWVRNIFTNIKTKVTSYGINNALVGVYIVVRINQEIIVPFEKIVENKDYEILVSSYLINGKVPDIYDNGFEINSKEYTR